MRYLRAIIVGALAACSFVACGPSDGDLGGDCMASDHFSLSAENTCNKPWVCGDDNKCHRPVPRLGCDQLTPPASQCAANEVSYQCNGDTPHHNSDCRAIAGTYLYCCPIDCRSGQGDASACGGDSVSATCSDPIPAADAGTCATFLDEPPDPAETTHYISCCLPGDGCFDTPAGSTSSCPNQRPTTYCTNGAVLHGNCTGIRSDQPGLNAFCCSER